MRTFTYTQESRIQIIPQNQNKLIRNKVFKGEDYASRARVNEQKSSIKNCLTLYFVVWCENNNKISGELSISGIYRV